MLRDAAQSHPQGIAIDPFVGIACAHHLRHLQRRRTIEQADFERSAVGENLGLENDFYQFLGARHINARHHQRKAMRVYLRSRERQFHTLQVHPLHARRRIYQGRSVDGNAVKTAIARLQLRPHFAYESSHFIAWRCSGIDLGVPSSFS